jgi:hypothetical protein
MLHAKEVTLAESRKELSQLYRKVEGLREDKLCKGYLEAVMHNRPELTTQAKVSTVVMLDNLRSVLNEESDASNISNFINYGFDLIAAVMPNLIAHDIVSVQPMTRRVGEIFFQDYRYGTSKGAITANDVLFSPFQSGTGDMYYSSETVYLEAVGTGDASTATFTHTAVHLPVVSGEFSLTDGTETFTPDSSTPTTLVGDLTGTGTIDYTTGAISVTFNTAPSAAQAITCTYKINFEENPDNIPQVDTNVYSQVVTAEKHALRAVYSLDAAYDLKMAFGRDMEADMLSALSNTIRANIDATIFDDLYVNAYSTIPAWTKTTAAGIHYLWHKESFKDVVIAASNKIFQNTRRVRGNFMVVGINVANVIMSLDGYKETAKKPLPGPHVLGTYLGMTIILNPYYPDNEYVMGYNGPEWLDTGYVYAPYMALFATPPVTLDDLKTRRGMETRYARKVVNARMYVKGSIIGGIVPAPTA